MSKKLNRKEAVLNKSTTPATLFVKRFARNKVAVAALVVILCLFLMACFAPWIAPYDYSAIDIKNKLQYPSAEHLLGTDNLGRDMLSRCIWGGRVSLLVALLSVSISTVAAIIIGSIAGYFGGQIDNVIMRICDVFLAIPGLVLAMCVSAALGTGIVNTCIAMAITATPGLVRQIRASIILLRDQEFIEASKAFGGSNARIIIKHVVPNAFAPMIIQIAMSLGSCIMQIAGLSFLGLGVQPPTPEWGNMVSAGRDYLTKFYPMFLYPALFVIVTMLSFNMVGDGLRDALDPHMKR